MASWGDGECDSFCHLPEEFELASRSGSRRAEGSEYAKEKWWQVRVELLQGVVVRVYYSRLTAAIYLATMLLAGVLLAITLGLDTSLKEAPGALLALEGLVSVSLFLEVGLRALVLGWQYLRTWPNVLDTLFAVASFLLMFVAAPRASKSSQFDRQKEDVELSQSLVMVRTMVQFGRVLLIAQHARRSNQARSAEDISFSHLIQGKDLDIDIDFSLLRERSLQEHHRSEDFDL